MIDWQPIRAEYITGSLSYRALSKKFGVNYNWLRERAKKEQWVRLRQEHREKTLGKTLEQISDQQADKLARFDALTDQLLEKLEKAISQLEQQQYRQTVREREYDAEQQLCIREVVRQEERLSEEPAPVDRRGLKQLTSALKDLREVKLLCARQENQEQVEVVLAAGPEEWNA